MGFLCFCGTKHLRRWLSWGKDCGADLPVFIWQGSILEMPRLAGETPPSACAQPGGVSQALLACCPQQRTSAALYV